MYLVDTNIFLEILLNQDKKEDCKKFLENNNGELFISDFSLHSIGVILFRYDKLNIFRDFIQDIFPDFNIVSLPRNQYEEIIKAKIEYSLDFDDAYQYRIALSFGLIIATMDKDFNKIKYENIVFI